MPQAILNSYAFAAPADFFSDDFDDYLAGSNLNGQNGGVGFTSPWVSRSGAVGIVATDNFDDYADLSNLDGQNGGVGWNGAWVSR